MFGSSHILGKPHYGPTSHTHNKCGKIPLGLPTFGSHFEELTLGKFGNIVWQSVALLGLDPKNSGVFVFIEISTSDYVRSKMSEVSVEA